MINKPVLRSLTLASMLAIELYGAQQKQDPTCDVYPSPMRITARHIEANGIGYNDGYTTLEGFFAPSTEWGAHWVPFLDLRGHIFNNGKFAANGGIGARYLTTSRIWGLNTYYDYRQTNRRDYNQVAVGFESLGKRWDFRLNGYLPVGKHTTSLYHTKFHDFKEHNMFLSSKKEFAFKGGNGEVGYHVDHIKHLPLYFAAGPYYLQGEGKSAWGGQLRAALDIFDYVRIEANTSYDTLFKWIGQGQIGLSFAFGGKKQPKDRPCTQPHAMLARAFQRVDRMEIIPTDTKKVISKAIDPSTGQPYFFLFVDNTSHSLGTYESPFNTLLNAQNASAVGDIIYVFPGDGTTTGMDLGIILKANQRFWGSGTSHQITTQLGAVSIPSLSTGIPHMTNINGDGITLANNVEVSGFSIDKTLDHGIFGASVGGVTITDTTIFHPSGHGIRIDESTAVYEKLSLARLDISWSASEGIFLSASGGADVAITIEDSLISRSGGSGIYFNTTGGSTITGAISKNSIQSNQDRGIFLRNDSSTNSLRIEGNTIEGSLVGIYGIFTNSVNNLTLKNNFVEGIGGGYGFIFTGSNHSLNLFSSYNVLIGSGKSGILIDGLSNLTFNSSHDTVSFYDTLIYIPDTGVTSSVTIDISNASLKYGGRGVYINSTSTNALAINVSDCTFDTLSEGINITTGDVVSSSTINIVGNSFEYNNSAIRLNCQEQAAGLTEINVTSNLIGFSSFDAISLITVPTTARTYQVEFSSNTIHHGGNNGSVYFSCNDPATTQITATGNRLFNSLFIPTWTVDSSTTASTCLNLQGNTSDTGYFLNNTGAIFNLAPGGVAGAQPLNSGTISTSGTITPVTSCP